MKDDKHSHLVLGLVILSSPCNRPFENQASYVVSPLLAEGHALREAVRLCAREEMKKVCFESDSAQLLKAINIGVCITEWFLIL